MRSDFKLAQTDCGWCERATECVTVDLDNGRKMHLCWSCLKKKAKLSNKNNDMSAAVPTVAKREA